MALRPRLCASRKPTARSSPLPVGEDDALMPSLLTLSDVMGTGHHAAVVAKVGPGKTRRGRRRRRGRPLRRDRREAPRRRADHHHGPPRGPDRARREFGATDVVSERGAEAVERVKELTGGYGVHSVLECVGHDQSMETAIAIARPGGAVGRVGVPQHDAIPTRERRSSRTSRSAAARHRFAPTSRSCCRTCSKGGSSPAASSTSV